MADISTVTPTDVTNMKNAIVNAMATGANRARIAQVLRAFQYASVTQGATTSAINAIQVSTDNTTWVDSIEFGIDQFPTISPFNISVVGGT